MSRDPGRGAGALVLVAAAVAVLAPGGASAQDPSLARVDSLAAAGEVIEARAQLETWWNADRDAADRAALQRALWLRALLTPDTREAELDYRRLVVEYPGGPYSDRAVVRLALAAHAGDDLRSAAGHFRTLLRDYPTSGLREDARSWLDRFGEQADANGGRNGKTAATPDPVVEADPGEPGRSPEAAQERDLSYAVQLGAFSSESRARRLLDRARSAGLGARLVRIPGSGLVRVRVGRFADSPGAEPVLREVRGLGFEATIVTDAGREVAVP